MPNFTLDRCNVNPKNRLLSKNNTGILRFTPPAGKLNLISAILVMRVMQVSVQIIYSLQ